MPVTQPGFYRYWLDPEHYPGFRELDRYAFVESVEDGWAYGFVTLGVAVDEQHLRTPHWSGLRTWASDTTTASLVRSVRDLSHWERVSWREIPPGWQEFFRCNLPSPAEFLALALEES